MSTAEEIAADLSKGEALEDSGLYKLLIETPSQDVNQGAFSVVIGNYIFEQTPPHAELKLASDLKSGLAP